MGNNVNRTILSIKMCARAIQSTNNNAIFEQFCYFTELCWNYPDFIRWNPFEKFEKDENITQLRQTGFIWFIYLELQLTKHTKLEETILYAKKSLSLRAAWSEHFFFWNFVFETILNENGYNQKN